MLYDGFLCIALLIVVGFIYKLVQMAIYGEAQLRQWADAGALDHDPLLATLLLLSLFAFFAKFWTRGGQTLGMQVWSIRVQNADGTGISLWQVLLRFLVAILSWLALGLGYLSGHWSTSASAAGTTCTRIASSYACPSTRTANDQSRLK